MNQTAKQEIRHDDYKGFAPHGARLEFALNYPYELLNSYQRLFFKSEKFQSIDANLKEVLDKFVKNGLAKFEFSTTEKEVRDLFERRILLRDLKNYVSIDEALIFYPLGTLLRLQHELICEFNATLPSYFEAKTFDLNGEVAKKLLKVVEKIRGVIDYKTRIKDLKFLDMQYLKLVNEGRENACIQFEFIKISKQLISGLQTCIDISEQFARAVKEKQGVQKENLNHNSQHNFDVQNFVDKIYDRQKKGLARFFEVLFQTINKVISQLFYKIVSLFYAKPKTFKEEALEVEIESNSCNLETGLTQNLTQNLTQHSTTQHLATQKEECLQDETHPKTTKSKKRRLGSRFFASTRSKESPAKSIIAAKTVGTSKDMQVAKKR
jgi:hypothetical protein